MKKKHFLVAAALAISSSLIAQSPADSSRTLEEVVFTANKYARKQSETGKVIHLITREQLDRSGARSLGEVLNQVAGTFLVGAAGSPGTNITASIRGASAGNVLILLDGVPVNDPSVITQYFDLNFIVPEQIERIEVLKGGQSTLYGSDAVAGVINIISRKATPGKTEWNGLLSGGRYGSFQQSAGITGKNKRINYGLHYSHLGAEGFSAATDSSKTAGFDKDGNDQHSLNGRFGVQLLPSLQLRLQGGWSRYKADLDAAAFTDERDFTATNDSRQAGAGLTWNRDQVQVILNYQYNRVVRSYLDDSSFISSPYAVFTSSSYTGRTHFAEAYAAWKTPHWEWLAGADMRASQTDQWYYSTGAFGPYAPPALSAKMTQVSPYVSVIYKTGRFQAEGGGRFNHHSVYGNNATFSFNPSYLLPSRVRLFANFYSAFKTPTLYQLFDGFAGNAALQPEKGIIGEAGASWTDAQHWQLRLTAYYRRSTDAIVYTYDPSSFAGKYLNAARQDNYGLEAEAAYRHGKYAVQLNYTYTDGKTHAAFDGTGAPLGKDTAYFNLYRIPRHRAQLQASAQWNKRWYTRLTLNGNSHREEYVYGDVPARLSGYVVADLDAGYTFYKGWTAFVSVGNLTGTRYAEIRGYNTRGFAATAGIRLRH